FQIADVNETRRDAAEGLEAAPILCHRPDQRLRPSCCLASAVGIVALCKTISDCGQGVDGISRFLDPTSMSQRLLPVSAAGGLFGERREDAVALVLQQLVVRL